MLQYQNPNFSRTKHTLVAIVARESKIDRLPAGAEWSVVLGLFGFRSCRMHALKENDDR